jgi:hypothetical protein
MVLQSCPALRQGGWALTDPHHLALLVEDNSWRKNQLESPILTVSTNNWEIGCLALITVEDSGGVTIKFIAAHPLYHLDHLLCRLSSGNSSSRILIGHFSWGNLQEGENGRTTAPQVQLIERLWLILMVSIHEYHSSPIAGHSLGLGNLPLRCVQAFNSEGSEPQSHFIYLPFIIKLEYWAFSSLPPSDSSSSISRMVAPFIVHCWHKEGKVVHWEP